ncbi:hypothetical protein UF75_1493 [Desulfosporosinus sp. I2]|uniref:TolC family protein n=1 Tax=Desulfosporosinus sp. I2 TaxID=1617025 RepID=UPI00061F5CAF|nr:TolC family protein [Desulfosporosinus sp. I2]KJR48140.1 hypothetical protein UF75_1493 [Desulfosporosinus sp. I2]
MKKGISILLVVFMLLISANTVVAAADSLDIEKVAIQSIKNSEGVQSINRQVTEAQKIHADTNGMVNGARGSLQYQNSYSIVKSIILSPLIAENNLEKVNHLQSVITNGVRLASYKDYINLLKVNYALNIQQGLMNESDADYRKAKLQETLGMVSQSQLRLSEIAYLKAKYRYNSAQKGFNSASMAVNKAMGEDISKQYSTLQDSNITPAAQIKSLNYYVGVALANRADIIDAQSTLELAKKEYEYGKAEIPTDFDFYIQQQEYAIDNAQNELDLAKITVQQNITNLYKDLGSAMKAMEEKRDLEDLAKLNYQAAEIRFNSSQISLQEFDDAKVARAQADINYKNAQLDAWLMQTMMDSACGIGYVPNLKAMSGSTTQSKSKNNPNPTNRRDRN